MFKEINLTLKDIDTGKREAVLAHATYKSMDRDGDRAHRGMFDKSWQYRFQDLRYFLNHDRKQAPGKPIRAWDDPDHAYTQVKHGTHTLGEDVLKMLDEGIIVAVSCGFDPTKQRKIPQKGYDYLEAFHGETSVLTHWAAHDESKVISVIKSAEQVVEDNKIKELSDAIVRMEKFCRNSTASDAAIIEISKELTKAKSLITKSTDTAHTDHSLLECPKCHIISVGIQEESGIIKCAECSHVLKGTRHQDASSKDEEMQLKLLFLKARMSMSDDD